MNLKCFKNIIIPSLVLWFALLGPTFGAAIPSTGFFTRANCSTIPNPSANSVVCLQTTTTGGRTAGKMYVWDGASYGEIQGAGAPTNATYITQTANGSLSAEQNLAALSTGILKSTTTTGVVSTAGAGTDYVAPGAITSSGLTQATGKLLGRGTAGTGAIEEITLGTNLSFAGTTLNATGGGSGGLTLVESKVITSNTTTVTFSGLNGDTDRVYRLVGSVITSTAGTLSLQPNGVSTNLFIAGTHMNSASSGIFNGTVWTLTSAQNISSGNSCVFDVVIFVAKSINSIAQNRWMTGTSTYGTAAALEHSVFGGEWVESSTNLTSLDIVGGVANLIGNGSHIALYKYQQ